MKKCTYCGKEYEDDATICLIDHEPLTSAPSPPPSSSDTFDAMPESSTAARLILGSIVLMGMAVLSFLWCLNTMRSERVLYVDGLFASLGLFAGSIYGLYRIFTVVSSKWFPRPPRPANSCPWCGRVKEGEATACSGCGTEF